MKNKYRNELKIINYITTTERYKAIFLVSIIISLYGGFILGGATENFFNSLLVPLQFPMFNVFFFAVIILNNINVCSIFKNSFPNYIMRLKSRKEYIKSIIRLSMIMFLFHFLIILLFILMCLFLINMTNFDIENYASYGTSNLIYVIFYLFRYIIFGILLTIIFSLIYINTNTKITLMFGGGFLLLMFYFGNIIQIRDSFSLSIWSYYTKTLYSTFGLEISSSVFMILLLEIIIAVLYFFSNKNKRFSIL